MKTITFANMKSMQPVVTFKDGSTLEGDVNLKKEIMGRIRSVGGTRDLTEELLEEVFQREIEAFSNMANLASITIYCNGNPVFINPKEILYVEIRFEVVE